MMVLEKSEGYTIILKLWEEDSMRNQANGVKNVLWWNLIQE